MKQEVEMQFENNYTVWQDAGTATTDFYKYLKSTENKGMVALSEIEKCIFDKKFDEYESVYIAVFYLGEKNTAETIKILNRVATSHPNPNIRESAMYSLYEAERIDLVRNAWSNEKDPDVKGQVSRDSLIHSELEKIIMDAGFAETDTHKLTSIINSVYLDDMKHISKTVCMSGIKEAREAFGDFVTDALFKKMISSKFTNDSTRAVVTNIYNGFLQGPPIQSFREKQNIFI